MGKLIYIPVKDCQKVFSISRSSIYRAVDRGDIQIHKAGGKALLKIEEVTDWIEKRA